MESVKSLKKETLHLARLRNIRTDIYKKTAELEVAVHTSKEPVLPGNQKNLDYIPISNKRIWAGVYGCAWFRIKGTIPKHAEGKHVVIKICIGGEAAVYDGCEPVSAITSVLGYVERIGASKGKSIIEISDIAIPNAPIEVYMDAGYNGYYNFPYGYGIFKYAYLCTVNDDLKDYYYDYLCLSSLLSVTKDTKRRKEINDLLNKSYATYHTSIASAREILGSQFHGTAEENIDFTAIGHSHLDLAWLWPVRETKRKAQRTFANQINNSDKYPEYTYGASQPWQFDYIKNNFPKQYSILKNKVSEGKFELQGGMWVEADMNLSSGEAIIRQILYGKEFFKNEFDKDMLMCWLPDVFGYNGNLPQLLKKSGLFYFMTTKLSWNEHNRFPHRSFIWKGIDDSEVLVHMPPDDTYNSAGSPACARHGADNYSERDKTPFALMVHGIGDGGGGPGDIHIELLSRQKSLQGSPKITMGKAIDFFQKLNMYREKLPKYKGELYFEKHQGTYTTQGKTKNYNRRSEYSLQTLEALNTLAWQQGMEYPKEKLDKWWKEVLLYQFHDILPGSSVNRVYTESHIRYEEILNEIAKGKEKIFEFLKRNEGISVFNPTSFTRKEFIKIDDTWYQTTVEPYAFSTVQLAKDYNVSFSDNIMENNYVRLSFSDNGDISSAINKKTNREYAKDNLNTLRIYKDKWRFFNAWDIDWEYYRKHSKVLKAYRSEFFTDGPSVVRRNWYKHKKTTITQDIILYDNSPIVYFKTYCDYHETFKMLRADFDFGVNSSFVSCDIQLGTITRSTGNTTDIEKAQFEICAHKYVDVSEKTHGISIMNDCKYGYRAKGNRISLCLLRSPVFPDKTADKGEHSFTYAMYMHENELGADTLAYSYALNKPLEVIRYATDNISIAGTDNENIVLETIKKSHTDDGIILRLFESQGKPAICSINTILKYTQAFETDLMENELNKIDLNSLSFTPFEIKTVKLK
ncbi:MAG: alpha-mannosidase [Clostridia bacterium]|nr:alpha-mannosidase [Clostridia bacterium]